MVLCFDFIGLGESEGDFVDSNFMFNVEDLEVVVNYLVENYVVFSLFIGYLLGGVVVIYVVDCIVSVKVIVMIGVLYDLVYVKYFF